MLSTKAKGSGHQKRHQHQPQQQPQQQQQQQAVAAAQEPLPVLDSVLDYEKLHRIGEGTYGVVYKGKLTLLYNQQLGSIPL